MRASNRVRNAPRFTARSRVATLLLVGVALISSDAAPASPLSGTLGVDVAANRDNAGTRAAIAALGLDFGAGPDLTLAGVRFDDAEVGLGTTAIAALGLPVAPALRLRGQASRIVGDGRYRGWRFKTGPQIAAPGGASLQLSYLHDEDNQGLRSDGAGIETAWPVGPALTARVNAAAATLPGDRRGASGTAGLAWSPRHGLELSCEAGASRNGVGVTSPGTAGSGLPLLGGVLGSPSSTRTENQISAVALFGVRWRLP
jgi:hypothetical protein